MDTEKNKTNSAFSQSTEQTTEDQPKKYEQYLNIFMEFIGMLIVIPLFLLFSNILPNPEWFLNIDRILLFLIILGITALIVGYFRYIFFFIVLGSIVFLTYGTFSGEQNKYGWKNLIFDYVAIIKESLEKQDENKNEQKNNEKKSKISYKDEILDACNYRESSVRTFALSHISDLSLNVGTEKIQISDNQKMREKYKEYNDSIKEYEKIIEKCEEIIKKYDENAYYYRYYNYYDYDYDERKNEIEKIKFEYQKLIEKYNSYLQKIEKGYNYYRQLSVKTILQVFSIFKYVNDKWEYVYDPKNEEYFAKASETIHTLKGDCDDYSILLASCIRAIGGESRIVLTKNHASPEFKIENKNWEEMMSLLSLTFDGIDSVYYHKDKEDTNVRWLNMDWGKYPGSKFLEENAKIYSIIDLKEKKISK